MDFLKFTQHPKLDPLTPILCGSDPLGASGEFITGTVWERMSGSSVFDCRQGLARALRRPALSRGCAVKPQRWSWYYQRIQHSLLSGVCLLLVLGPLSLCLQIPADMPPGLV